jgi:hypothetical protein
MNELDSPFLRDLVWAVRAPYSRRRHCLTDVESVGERH